MRPISLTIEAFGSYSKKTEIDFNHLTEPIFLITGDTGSGKSTIFDAMVFALYGKSSSNSGKEGFLDFQSQYGDIKPSVSFKFEKNNKEYVVTRSYNVSRNNKSEVKKFNASSKLSLILDDNVEFLGKVPETEKKIKEIVGLTKEQFMQIAMIAQGEFMALLRAGSKDKKEIFRNLFHTEKYNKIIEAIKEKRKKLNDEVDKVGNFCKKDIGRIKTQNENIKYLQNKIITDKALNIVDMETFLEFLENDIQNSESKKNAIEKDIKTLKDEWEILNKKFIRGEELKKNFDLLKTEELKLNELLKNEDTVKRFKKLAEEITKSYELKEKFKLYENANTNLKNLKDNLENATKNFPVLKDKLKAKESELKNAEKQAKNSTSILQETITKAKSAVEIFEHLKQIEKELNNAKKQLKIENTKKDTLMLELEKLNKEIESKKKETENLTTIEARKEKLKKAQEDLTTFTVFAKKVADSEKEIKSCDDKLKKLQNEYEAKSLKLKKIENEYREKENIFFDSQAGILAKKLEDGKPCPVCGSYEHLNPAKFNGEEIKKEELDALQEKLKMAREERENASKNAESQKIILSSNEKNHNEKIEEIKDFILSKNIEITEKISAEYLRDVYMGINNDLKEKIDELRKDELTLKDAKDFLTNGEKLKKELEQKKEKSEKNRIELTKIFSTLEGKHESLTKAKTFDDVNEANNALNEALKKQEIINENLKNIRTQRDDIKSQYEKCETLIGEYKSNLPQKESELKNAEEKYFSLKLKSDLSDEEWKKIVDNHKDEESEKLKKKVDDFIKQKNLLEGSIATLKSKTANESPPDLESLGKILAEKKEILSQNEETLNVLREDFSNNKDAFHSLNREKSSREKLLSEFQVYDKLYNRLSSSARGGYLDIETFAQRYYLSEILSCANERLRLMTGGQYELRLVENKVANAFSNRGLDFMIYSYATGKTREIKTLSGGESFLTALSLALGMADRIEKRVSAISPDILFIDEGFGSLDDSARHNAVNVLKDIAGAHRLIGVISHVNELRQEIDTKLIVKKDIEGSAVRWES